MRIQSLGSEAPMSAILSTDGPIASGFERLFQPRSIAIVGASSDLDSINGQPQRNLLARGYPGRLFPVNPKYEQIADLRCFASVDALPETPDLAIVLLGAANAVEAVAACGVRGVPFAIVIGAGFAEVGEAGLRLQEELISAARRTGIRLIGPNCIGLMNVPDNVFAGFGPIFGLSGLKAGAVSMVSQSGGFGFGVVNMAEELGVGFRHVVSTGNEADIGSLDLMGAFIEDPQTRILAGYFEGLRDARRLSSIGRRALDARKPVIVWKVGDSDAGERAAVSHTGNLGGAAALYRAAFDQFGWIRIDDVPELVDCVRAFEGGKLPETPAVGIVTVSGGAGVLAADVCSAHGLQVPELSEATLAALRSVLPSYASPQNPVDVTASVLNEPALLKSALRIVLADPGIGSLIVVASSVEGAMAERIAGELTAFASETTKPMMVSWNARETRVGSAFETLRGAAIPLYRTPTQCCRALGALWRFADAIQRHRRDEPFMRNGRIAPVARVTAEAVRGATNEHRAKQVLARYGLQATQEYLCRDADDAVEAARRIGGPVAVKIQSQDIAHKTEANAIRLGVSGDAAVRSACAEVLDSASRHAPRARIDGLLVQEMAGEGVEVILGGVDDPRFGPAVMFGLGGVFTEVLDDVVFRLAPVSMATAREMIASIKGHAVLRGARGRPACDIDALARAIVGISELMHEHVGTLKELDINPLVVLPEGRGVRVVDALFVTTGP